MYFTARYNNIIASRKMQKICFLRLSIILLVLHPALLRNNILMWMSNRRNKAEVIGMSSADLYSKKDVKTLFADLRNLLDMREKLGLKECEEIDIIIKTLAKKDKEKVNAFVKQSNLLLSAKYTEQEVNNPMVKAVMLRTQAFLIARGHDMAYQHIVSPVHDWLFVQQQPKK